MAVALLGLHDDVHGGGHTDRDTAIIVPGTGTPDPTIPTNYMNNAVNYYVVPSAVASAPAPPARTVR